MAIRRSLFTTLVAVIVIAGCTSGGGATTRPTIEVTPTAEPTPAPELAPTPAVTIPTTFSKLSSRNWAKVAKAPDNYVGKGYWLWACITQFDAATGQDAFRANASYRKETYPSVEGDNAFFTGDEAKLADFVQGDLVYMKAVDAGSFSYDTQIGGNTTVPLFYVVSIARKGSCE